MTAKLLSGKDVAQAILDQAKKDAAELKAKGINPKLVVLRVGEDPGSISYEKGIISTVNDVDIDFENKVFPEDVSQEEFMATLNEFNNDKNVSGILVFKPLPAQLDEEEIKYALNTLKDPDAMNPTNLGKLMIDDVRGFSPCTPEGVMEMFDYYGIDLVGKDVVVINRSVVFGKPMAMMLASASATVTICHSKTKNLAEKCKAADIVITATGRYGMVTPDMLGDNTIVIDVAMAQKKDKDGNFVLNEKGKKIRTGDCVEECAEKAAMITSATPGCGGGTGPITSALLTKHLIKGCKMLNGLL
ncbi:MAG: bifunctional 5,10-methylenetetrahydrofolate dehydrogenase/5,10-methenyltetrahydrofolate cyclohydrolase [Eubacteriaceae bacterium]|nr:bifunctional 5,10-methylenetetrahydrofolate dehydrogenase/5,10-methenyltetrahydrofolate cyclohydrolase [Eubacteriaceae bacterium]